MIIGGKLNFDAYNNGGEWIDSVFDVGPDLVRKNAWTIISLSSSWDLCMQRTSIGKKDTSLEMGRHSSLCHSVGQKGKVASICNLCFSRFEFNFSQFVAKTWESHGQGRAR